MEEQKITKEKVNASWDALKEKQCPFCAETIKKDASFCKFCKRDLSSREPHLASAISSPACPICGGEMDKTVKTQNGLGCLLMIAGLFLIPAFGLGLIVIIIGVIVGSKKQGYWACKKCGHLLPRQVGLME